LAADWQGIEQIFRLECTITKQGSTKQEVVYGLTKVGGGFERSAAKGERRGGVLNKHSLDVGDPVAADVAENGAIGGDRVEDGEDLVGSRSRAINTRFPRLKKTREVL
jgi:hypothetical protein